MKRSRGKTSPARLNREAERLVTLAMGLSASGSHVEDVFWESRLAEQVAHVLDEGSDASLETALDSLYAAETGAYDVLIDAAEAQAESLLVDAEDVLLVAAPVLAWSKYSIYSGPLGAEVLTALTAQLHGHVAAKTARIAVAPYLYSIDQLPQRFSKTRGLTRELGVRAHGGEDRRPAKVALPETAPLLSDTRYLLAAFRAPRGEPHFVWQEGLLERPREALDRSSALERWRAGAGPLFAQVLTGCTTDVLIPDAYHVSCREADRAVRPFGIRAGVAFLESALKVEASALRAVVALFGNERGEEYRIGFTLRQSNDILHGVVWPLYGREEGPEPEGPRDQIEALLKECAISESLVIDQMFPLEFCEDCGAPLFSDPMGELVHPELPEDAEEPKAHFH